jgi:hypothetical protein
LASCLAEIAPAADAAGAVSVPTAQPADSGRVSVSAVVAGIVGYTRWPSDAPSIVLCTLGQGPGVEELLSASARLGSAQRPVLVQALAGPDAASAPCDAVYIGAPAGGSGREALKRLAGRPVLLLGEGPDFCTDGGMFCLAPGAGAVRFNANLDAIARSGLRINPQVLRIARGAAAAGS